MRKWLAIVAAMAAFPAAAQTGGGEHVGQAPLPGFFLAHRVEAGGSLIEERIPEGETVEAWSRMVTVQRFAGASRRLPPAVLLANIESNLRTSCPGATTTAISEATVSGRRAARMRADCPRLAETGLPESFVMLVIEGSSDLHVAQVAFRRVPTEADLAWADRHLASVVVCDRASREAVCR